MSMTLSAIVRGFGRGPSAQFLGVPTDPPNWCEPGQGLPCLCETDRTPTPGCTPAPSCDAPGAEQPCIFPAPTGGSLLLEIAPYAAAGAAVGGLAAYALKPTRGAVVVGAGLGAVAGPILTVIGAVLVTGRVG